MSSSTASIQPHVPPSERLVVDTAILSVDELVARVEDYVGDTNSKPFFFEKKKQKTFAPLGRRRPCIPVPN